LRRAGLGLVENGAGRPWGKVRHQAEIVALDLPGGLLGGVALSERRTLAAGELLDHSAFVGAEESVVTHLPALGVWFFIGSARNLDDPHEGFGDTLAAADRQIIGRIGHFRPDHILKDLVRGCFSDPRRGDQQREQVGRCRV
jgi:hypothetical protein